LSDMTPREHRVRARAQELWEKAGRPEGQDERFWYEAEQELDAEDNRHRSTTRTVPRMPQPSDD
jgi:Protein of unknown function (DUF2934)